MKEFTLERNRLAVPCVRNRSPSQETCGHIKEFTLLKNSETGLSAQSCLPFLAEEMQCHSLLLKPLLVVCARLFSSKVPCSNIFVDSFFLANIMDPIHVAGVFILFVNYFNLTSYVCTVHSIV